MKDHSDVADSFAFLQLPRELGDSVYGYYFFSNPDRRIQAYRYGDAAAWWDPSSYYYNGSRNPISPTYLLYTNHQILRESEEVIYGTATFCFVNENELPRSRKSTRVAPHKYLQNLCQRHRRMVRKVELPYFGKGYNNCKFESSTAHVLNKLQTWTASIIFLAGECHITELTLIGSRELCGRPTHSDMTNTGRPGFETGRDGDAIVKGPWMQPLQQFKNLRKIHIIGYGPKDVRQYIRRLPALTPELVTALDSNNPQQFPKFLQLPSELRDQIYGLVMIPLDGTIHPYIRSWYDSATRNIVPLFLTCHQIHNEAQDMLYRSAIFASSVARYDARFLTFLKERSPATRQQIQHLKLLAQPNLSLNLIEYLAYEMPHLKITCVVPEICVSRFIKTWLRGGSNWCRLFKPLFARFKEFRVETAAAERPMEENEYIRIYQPNTWRDTEVPPKIHYNVPQSIRL